jgi:DNA-binding protein HU-beta
MTNKELISELSVKNNFPQKKTGELLKTFVKLLTDNVIEGNQINFFNIGTFGLQQKEQRISVNPSTKKSFLVPPKIVVDFKPTTAIKNYFKTLEL